MTNVRTIHVDWYSQRPPRFSGGPQLAYQGDHLSNMVVFDNAPELPNYHLLVRMKTDDTGQVVDLPAILLEGPYWVIPNYYTQICQQITYQVCCKTGTNDYEHHSAKFKGTILPVLKHNGEPIDLSPMFDPYMDILDKRVNELIVAAGDIQIDSELKSDSTNPVQNKIVKAAIDDLTDDVDTVNGRLQRQQGIIAEAFSAQSTYDVGDSVIYEAGLYTFRANKVAGAWDATKVDGPFKVTEQISNLKEDLLILETDGTARFSAAKFYNRGLDSVGNFNSEKYRVSSREITTASHDCTLTPTIGFRFYIYIYDASDAISKYGWFTTTYNLSAGTRYKLLIARTTENTSEEANIAEFVNAILVGTYISALGDSVENLKNENTLTGWVADNVLTDRVSVLVAFPQTSNYAFVISSGKVSLAGTTNYKYRVGSVVEGHKYHIKATIGNTAYGYAFTDSDDNYLTSDNVHAATEQVEYDVIAPVGASKLYVNALKKLFF